MKALCLSHKILFCFFLLISVVNYASTVDTVYVHSDSLKDRSISLDSVWRYHAGDDSVWAEQGFDDSDWDTLKTRLPSASTSKDFWKGIGWFKTNIKIDRYFILSS